VTKAACSNCFCITWSSEHHRYTNKNNGNLMAVGS